MRREENLESTGNKGKLVDVCDFFGVCISVLLPLYMFLATFIPRVKTLVFICFMFFLMIFLFLLESYFFSVVYLNALKGI